MIALVPAASFVLVQGSPRSPEDELAAFHLAEGFVAELVAAEPDVKKIVDLAFDDAGRMWAITASEYPLDGNESPRAADVYKEGGGDQVLVFDTPTESGRQVPRVFAEGLALPLAILPDGDGALVGHGPEILRLRDRDGDGHAETREVVLSGFGIEDSHLLPHRLIRGPGGWIYVAQGAFNHSQVRTRSGASVDFELCKLARFRADGSAFEVVGFGLNNIWGIVLDRTGRWWIQEANDLGYPLVPFFPYASYPGIGDAKHRPYSPWQPALASFPMGGTGLSGLALVQDPACFPPPWDETFFLANPIVNGIQSIAVDRSSEPVRLERRGDLLTSDDPWFRPVAVHFGPDGAFYVVDWYNEIISHNEVPRTDPRRDKVKSRIWRIRAKASRPRAPRDLTRASAAELLLALDSDSTLEARAAWHQIGARGARELATELSSLARDPARHVRTRILALWSLEDLGQHGIALLTELAQSSDADLAREAVRASGSARASPRERLDFLRGVPAPRDTAGRAELVLALRAALLRAADLETLLLLADCAEAPSSEDSPSERYARYVQSLIRSALEDVEPGLLHSAVDALATTLAGVETMEGLAAMSLTLGDVRGAQRLAFALEKLGRPASSEELAHLVAHAADAEVRRALVRELRDPLRSSAALRAILALGEKGGVLALRSEIEVALRTRLVTATGGEAQDLLLDAAQSLGLVDLAPEVEGIALDRNASSARRARALAALARLGDPASARCFELARESLPQDELQRVAVLQLVEVHGERELAWLLELWPSLSPTLRRTALAGFSSTAAGAKLALQALLTGELESRDLDERLAARLREVAAGAEQRTALDERLASFSVPALYLDGSSEACLDTDVAIAGAFTLEAWVKLESPITNADGILAGPDGPDFNFSDGRFRYWAGPEQGDVIIAKRAIEPDTWTHVALTREASGALALYVNGELDRRAAMEVAIAHAHLDVGRTIPMEGTRGWIAELRLWSRARSEIEIGASWRCALAASEPGLLRQFSRAEDFAPLAGSARVERSFDGPLLLDPEEARALEERFAKVRALAQSGGDPELGRAVFARTCQVCHTVAREGAAIGPPLDGAALRGVEGLLSSVLTPNAAVESGYRLLLVETRAGERLDGFLASQDERSIVLRRQGREDLRLGRSELASSAFDRLSVMPEGLLEGLSDSEIAALFAYLLSLR